jgi:predicted Zn finger-like uncharacterized protein
MLIVCKTCASSYHIPREIFGESGCQLRCVGCGETWMVTREAVAADGASLGWDEDIASDASQHGRYDPHRFPPEISGPAALASRGPAALSRKPRLLPLLMRKAHEAAAIVGAIAFLGAAMGALAARASLVAAIPGTARIFAAVGLPVNLRGLALDNLRTNIFASDDRKMLVVEGAIVNLRDGPTPAPNMRIALRGADKRELYVWTAPAPKAMLGPSEQVAFRTRLAAPPAGVSDVLVRFAAAADKVTPMKEGL